MPCTHSLFPAYKQKLNHTIIKINPIIIIIMNRKYTNDWNEWLWLERVILLLRPSIVNNDDDVYLPRASDNIIVSASLVTCMLIRNSGHYTCNVHLRRSRVISPSTFTMSSTLLFSLHWFSMFITSQQHASAKKKKNYLNKMLSSIIWWHCFDFRSSTSVSHAGSLCRSSEHRTLTEDTSLAMRV